MSKKTIKNRGQSHIVSKYIAINNTIHILKTYLRKLFRIDMHYLSVTATTERLREFPLLSATYDLCTCVYAIITCRVYNFTLDIVCISYIILRLQPPAG